jgi:hypothetical protein
MQECTGELERARCALAILIEHTGADIGHLYSMREGRFTRLCSQPLIVMPRELVAALESSMRLAIDNTAAQVVSSIWTDADGNRFESLLLSTESEDGVVIAAVAALGYAHERRSTPSAAVLGALAAGLLDSDDVDAITCIG